MFGLGFILLLLGFVKKNVNFWSCNMSFNACLSAKMLIGGIAVRAHFLDGFYTFVETLYIAILGKTVGVSISIYCE